MNRFNTDDGTTGYNDLFAKREVVDERMQFAVNLGTILVRLLDKMGAEPLMRESAFELGSGEGSTFEIIVRRK